MTPLIVALIAMAIIALLACGIILILLGAVESYVDEIRELGDELAAERELRTKIARRLLTLETERITQIAQADHMVAEIMAEVARLDAEGLLATVESNVVDLFAADLDRLDEVAESWTDGAS